MATDSAESMKFVLLIEENKDVLLKSQGAELKQKKTEAVGKIIPKWAEICGKTLTQASLFKKINNFKSRAKTVLNSGKTLSDWQAKLLEIVGAVVGADDDLELANSTSTVILSDEITGDSSSSNKSREMKSGAEQLLDQHETDETKLLNKEQLQRLVLLKQVKVLTLQQQRLERSEGFTHIKNGKDITFDLVSWEETNQIV